MTQLPHDDFEMSLEKAEAWMKEIHERLKENDNTQGPRSALESRLRETERICSLEGDGKLLLDKALMKAEILLSESGEDEKHQIHLKLAKIKGLFEETSTYMIHCHSRIEWVWLHWNEYLRARDEFTLWVHNMALTLEPDMELQLGLKEKRWQYEQALVLMKDVLNHSCLVDRLLEEAASLYNRIGDPSVDENVQSAMMAEYIQIKKKAQERVEHLEKIWKDHEVYEGDVNGFKTWLNSVIEKLKSYVGAASNSTENRLSMLQDISKDVESGDKQLEVLELKSAHVIKNTSPMGAEKICKELEELRKTLKELKQMNDEEEETLLKTHNSENAFLLLAQQLEANIKEFCKATQRLEESLESGERVKNEDDLIALWKTLNATKSALAAEEAKAERVKVQLRDLFKFSKDVQPLSDGVISAMRDYQRAKSKAFKLSSDAESELRQIFQNPLREFLYWKPIAESVLDATAVPVNDGAMNLDALDNIEKLLNESCTIKDELVTLEKKKERIHLVLGEEKTKTLLQDIAAAEKEREALHQDLLQRKNWLQSLAEQREELNSAFKTLHHKISAIRVKSIKESELQPDIHGKEAQVQRLEILLEELLSLNSPIQELISRTKSHSAHAPRAQQLNSDYLTLQRFLENAIRKSKENINNHRLFCHHLQDLQHWVMAPRQKLESCQKDGRHWSLRDIETLKAELSEKEIQLHVVEAHGQKVIDTSSPEGGAIIQTELNQLMDSWKSLQQLWKIMSSNSPDAQVFHVPPPEDVAPRIPGFCHIGDLSGSNVPTSSIPEPPDAAPSAVSVPKENGRNYETLTINEKADDEPTLGSPDQRNSVSNKRTAVRRIDGASGTDLSNFQFRVIDQRDGIQEDGKSEILGSTSAGNADSDGKRISSGRGRIKRGSDNEVYGPGGRDEGEAPGQDRNGGSGRTSLEEDEEFHGGAEVQISAADLQNTSGFVTEENVNKKEKSPNKTRRNRKFVSLAESVDVVDSSSATRTGGNKAGDDHMKLLLEFDQWLQEESSKLNRICAAQVPGSNGIKVLQSRLQNLHLRVPKGQKLFECLLRSRTSMTVTEDLKMEELRYLWMLYKSKLRDSGKHSNLRTTEEARGVTKTSGGVGSFLHRVCCAALPLQLLLLLLLLMAFLLPLLNDTKNCALSNNFARSFNLMLKYDGPPPT